MKRTLPFVFGIIFIIMPLVSSADVIYLKNGEKIEAPDVWEENGWVKYEVSGIEVSFSKNEVERVEKRKFKKKEFKSDRTPAKQETIGRWIVDDYPSLKGSTLEIYKKGGNFFLYWKFADGSKGTYELNSRGKATFFMIDSGPGDHFVINRMNHLEVRDVDGLITIARPLR